MQLGLLVVFFYIGASRITNYGIDLELNNFTVVDDPEGFQADFTLNRDVNYNSFKLFIKGTNKEGDRLLINLNNEYSTNSSQKRGSTFTIIYKYDMKKFQQGRYYFLLDNQDGNSYRSNIFTSDGKGVFKIMKPMGKPIQEPVAESLLQKYKYYIFGTSIVLGVTLIYFVTVAIKTRKD
ncbi:hypothetical protein COBT_000541 [Conglomerata obtusa]